MNGLYQASFAMAAVFVMLLPQSAMSQVDNSDTYLREDPDYQIPTSEPLYEPGPRGALVDFGSHVQAGGLLSFGLSSSPGSDPVTSMLVGGQVLYRAGMTSWSRFEAGFQLLSGVAGYEEADINVSGLALAKVGYGYSIGNGVFGTFGVGFGASVAGFDGDVDDVEVESDDAMTGFVSNLEFGLNLNPKGTVEFGAGVAYTNIVYNLDSIKGSDDNFDKSITIQIPRVFLSASLNI